MLSKGNLKAEGSAAELKAKFGGGYRVRVPHKSNWKAEGLEYAHCLVDNEDAVYQLADSTQAAPFVKGLDKDHVEDYQVLGPTIEDVFLKLAEEVRDDRDVVVAVQAPAHDKGSSSSSIPPETEAPKDGETALQLYSGHGTTMLRQSWVLFRKRVTVFKRGWLPYFFATIIPIITAGLVTYFLNDFSKLTCSPESQVSEGDPEGLGTSSLDLLIPLGPNSRITPQLVAAALHQNQSWFHSVNTLGDFNQYVREQYANITPGGFFLGQSSSDVPTMAYVGNWQVYTPMLTQNLLNNVLSNTTIAAQYQSFALPLPSKAANTLQLILYFGLAMAAFPGFFALYPTTERLRNVRSLHYSNGIRAAPLWAASTAFDFLFILLISALVIIMWTAVSSVWYAPGYLFVVFVLYGLSTVLMSYCVSLFVSSPLAAFAFAAGGQAVFFLIYFVTFMCIVYVGSLPSHLPVALLTCGTGHTLRRRRLTATS